MLCSCVKEKCFSWSQSLLRDRLHKPGFGGSLSLLRLSLSPQTPEETLFWFNTKVFRHTQNWFLTIEVALQKRKFCETRNSLSKERRRVISRTFRSLHINVVEETDTQGCSACQLLFKCQTKVPQDFVNLIIVLGIRMKWAWPVGEVWTFRNQRFFRIQIQILL